MAQDSGITWTHHTFNPWTGCEKVSPGCKFCYAESLSKRFNKSTISGSIGSWGKDGTRKVKAESGWDEPLKWNKWASNAICYSCGGSGEKKERDVECGIGVVKSKPCLTCNGAGRFKRPYEALVFCASLGDLFEAYDRPLVSVHNDPMFAGLNFYRINDDGMGPISSKWFTKLRTTNLRHNVPLTMDHVLFRLFEMIRQTPNLTWLLLTKRPERILQTLISTSRTMYGSEYDETVIGLANWAAGIEIPRNVAMGTSVESQEYVGRLDHLLKVPARLHWVSAEPLLGSLDVEPYLDQGLKWVVAGGESGKDKDVRPCHPEWVRSLRDQCIRKNACFHFKQWGEYADLTSDQNGSESLKKSTSDIIFKPSGEIVGAGYRDGKESNGYVDEDWRNQNAAWMGRIGKSKAGRLLDGKIEDGFPDLFNMPEVIEPSKPKIEPLPAGYSLAERVDTGGSD